jgi:hypothetical protein
MERVYGKRPVLAEAFDCFGIACVETFAALRHSD